MKYIIYYLFVIVCFASCTGIYTTLTGIKQPHLETKESLRTYMIRNAIDSNLTYLPADSTSVFTLVRIADANMRILIFNRNERLNRYSGNSGCPAPVENYLKSLCTLSSLEIDSSVTCKKIFSLIKPFGISGKDATKPQPDFTVFIFWSVWLNRKNKSLHDWYHILSGLRNQCDIKILFVNTDFRAEDYGFTQRKKLKADYSAHTTHRRKPG